MYGTIRAWQVLDDATWSDAIDTNNDGLVSKDEFTAMIGSAKLSQLATMSALNRFSAADKNDDEWLSESDVSRYRNPLWEGGRMFRWAINTFLLELDADEDGTISESEYLSQGGGVLRQ